MLNLIPLPTQRTSLIQVHAMRSWKAMCKCKEYIKWCRALFRSQRSALIKSAKQYGLYMGLPLIFPLEKIKWNDAESSSATGPKHSAHSMPGLDMLSLVPLPTQPTVSSMPSRAPNYHF